MATEQETRAQFEALLVQVFDLNRAFLALASPTAAQVRDQTRLLTREMQVLLRERLGRLDAVD